MGSGRRGRVKSCRINHVRKYEVSSVRLCLFVEYSLFGDRWSLCQLNCQRMLFRSCCRISNSAQSSSLPCKGRNQHPLSAHQGEVHLPAQDTGCPLPHLLQKAWLLECPKKKFLFILLPRFYHWCQMVKNQCRLWVYNAQFFCCLWKLFDTSGQTAEEQNLKKCVFWDTLMPTYHVTGKKQCWQKVEGCPHSCLTTNNTRIRIRWRQKMSFPVIGRTPCCHGVPVEVEVEILKWSKQKWLVQCTF